MGSLIFFRHLTAQQVLSFTALLFSVALSLVAGQDDYVNLKCWRNKVPQEVTRLEGTDDILDRHNYKKRADAINKCHVAAKAAGYDFFSIGNGGQCWAGKGQEYKKYGLVTKCPEDGKGFYGAMNVYEFIEETVQTTTPEPTHVCGGGE